MAYQVIFSKRFANKVVKTSNYLEGQWSSKVANEFHKKVDEKILAISVNPEIGARSLKFPEIRKLTVTKHNKIYYRIKGRRITLVDFVETKMNPRRNKYE